MTRLLATGDWHVGAGLDYGATPLERLEDQRAVIMRICDLAIENEVDALLLAGDLWHRRRPTPAELLVVFEPLHDLHRKTGIDILAIPGNHDVETADGPIALDLLQDFVDVRHYPGVWQTRGCAVACLPWAPVSRLVAQREGGDRDSVHAEAAELLVRAAGGMRERIDGTAVLLLHFSVSGASTPTGAATDDFREVVLSATELRELGFDAVIAGHIHKPQTFPGGFYVGSPAPVDFGEAESGHGCFLLDAETGDARFLPIESRRFITLNHLGSEPWEWPKLWDGSPARGVQDAVVRVRYRATEEQARRIDAGAIRQALYEAGAHRVYAIQADIIRADRARVTGVDESLEPLAALGAWTAANECSEAETLFLDETTSRYIEAGA